MIFTRFSMDVVNAFNVRYLVAPTSAAILAATCAVIAEVLFQEATDTYQNTVVRVLVHFCLWGVAKLPIALWIYSSWINEPVEDRKKRWAPKTEANILLFWLGGWLISRAALSSLDYHGRGHILRNC